MSSRIKDSRRVCDVGFHSKGDGGHHHRLSIVAYNHAVPGGCSRTFTTDPDGGDHFTVTSLQMDVSGAPEPFRTNGVYFYQPTNPVRSRGDLDDPKDFRWIIDFESEYLYLTDINPEKSLPKKKGTYNPILGDNIVD